MKLATAAPGSVGFTKKYVRSVEIALQVAAGVLHCAAGVASCYDCCEK